MKTPLRYQITEFDCGPTSLLNGVSYLFEREEIPPEVVRNIMLFCMDQYDEKGISGQMGTSHTAMMFLSHWLDGFGKTGRMNIQSSYLTGGDVTLIKGSRLRSVISRGGTAVARVDLDGWHYILLTEFREERVMVFDPYLCADTSTDPDVEIIPDRICKCNRAVPVSRFDSTDFHHYSFGPFETREAVLLCNTETFLPEEYAVDYII